MRLAPTLIVIAASAATSLAQTGTGRIWYEASPDNGTTWLQSYLLVGMDQTDVLVRVRATWSGDAGMYAFAGAQFDVQITEAASDSVTEMVRPGSMGVGSVQTLVASHFGSTIKIDDSRDTSAPGVGTRGVFPGQLVQNFAGTNFTTANPVTIFQFRLTFGDFTIRQLSSLYTGGIDTNTRYMRIYTTPTGGQNTPATTTTGMTIDNYTPAPGPALTFAIAGGAALGRRRRR